MSRPANEVAERLARLRAETRARVLEAEADQARRKELTTKIEALTQERNELDKKYNSYEFVRVVEEQARSRATAIAMEALALRETQIVEPEPLPVSPIVGPTGPIGWAGVTGVPVAPVEPPWMPPRGTFGTTGPHPPDELVEVAIDAINREELLEPNNEEKETP